MAGATSEKGLVGEWFDACYSADSMATRAGRLGAQTYGCECEECGSGRVVANSETLRKALWEI
jgi:hypothetical protein